MNDFVAVDVETANGAPTSICSIGAVKVLDGEIVDSFYELVKPEPNFYFRHFTENIHGIDRHIRYRMASCPQIYRSASSCGP